MAAVSPREGQIRAMMMSDYTSKVKIYNIECQKIHLCPSFQCFGNLQHVLWGESGAQTKICDSQHVFVKKRLFNSIKFIY